MSGLARQNTNKSIKNLEYAGLIKCRYGTIEIIDLLGLKEVARAAIA